MLLVTSGLVPLQGLAVALSSPQSESKKEAVFQHSELGYGFFVFIVTAAGFWKVLKKIFMNSFGTGNLRGKGHV